MQFVPLGSTTTIGASCHYVNIGGTGILLDAGVDPEADGPESLPRFGLLHENGNWPVDHLIVTHAHHDHLGALPVLVREFPRVRVHMTPATRELADILLPASARLQRRKVSEGSSVHRPLFAEDEVDLVSYLYEEQELATEFDLIGARGKIDVAGRFYNSGHILGSAGIQLLYNEDGQQKRLFYTSDTNLQPQTIIPGAEYPSGVDTLVLESTMGADPKAEDVSRGDEEDKLGEAIRRILEGGGCVLIPVFALGRAQEVLALIERYKRRGLVRDDVPVYTAGSMRAMASLYDKTRHTTPRLNPDFEVEQVDQQRVPRSPRKIAESVDSPSIHVVASGMLFERTLSNRLAQLVAAKEENAVFFVGYVREDSPGERLVAAAGRDGSGRAILSEERGEQEIRCEVDQFKLSGHSHRQDLIKLVGQLAPKDVILVHGEREAQEWMAGAITAAYPDVTTYVPECGEPVIL